MDFGLLRSSTRSLIHHDLGRLVEAHVAVADQPLGLLRQQLVVVAAIEEVDALLRQPVGQVGDVGDLGNVVTVLFS